MTFNLQVLTGDPQQQYGGYSNGGGGGGGYGQANPYEQTGNRYEQQEGRYDQESSNPYAQQASNPYASQPTAPQQAYGGRQQQGGYDGRYGQAQTTNGGSSTYPAGAGATGGGYGKVNAEDSVGTRINGH